MNEVHIDARPSDCLVIALKRGVEIFATDDVCTHAYAKLSDGWLDKGEIECPLHAGRFDVKTGKATAPPCTDDLKTYPVRVSGNEIQVKLD